MTRLLLCTVAGLAASASAQSLCGDWSIVPTIDRGSVTNLLYDVAFAGEHDGLAVGNWNSGAGVNPFIQRWDGSAWTELSLPSTAALGNFPQVEGAGFDGQQLWVVGSVRTPYPTDNMPLIMCWDGAAWTSAQTPTLRIQNTYPFGPRGGLAEDVIGLAPDDLWVVGSAAGYGDASATSVPLALHFDGSDWHDVEVPLIGNRSHSLDDVSASSSDNVWAVGYWRSIAQNYQALVVRWDGSQWHLVANPGESPAGGDATAVVALAPGDVWVSGNFNSGADHLIHWNGSSWDISDADLPGPFASMVALAPDDIWGSCAINATYYHYDGLTWTPVSGPSIAGSTYVLRGWGLAAINSCDIWSVGGWSDGSLQRTLAEHLGSTGCASDINADGTLDFFDVQAFLAAFSSHDPAADLVADGVFNFFDVQAYLAGFAAGCP